MLTSGPRIPSAPTVPVGREVVDLARLIGRTGSACAANGPRATSAKQALSQRCILLDYHSWLEVPLNCAVGNWQACGLRHSRNENTHRPQSPPAEVIRGNGTTD